jgi:hypothetical protein
MSFALMVVLLVGLPALAYAAVAVVQRPQRGLLLVAVLIPFDGLLQIVPGGETFGPWKEALILLTLAAAVVSPRARHADGPAQLPPWVPALTAFVALGLVSAAFTGGSVALWGLKVSYFYAVVPFILMRCPFTLRDRDRLVSILMATGAATAVIGVAQQVAGHARLNELGWEYDTAIRFSGSLLRSFSTFTQPFSFGFFMSLVLLVCLPVALSDLRRTRNRLFLLATPLLVVGMATSVVRGAILALVVGLVVLMVWRFRGLFHAAVVSAIVLLLVPAAVMSDFLSSSSLDARTTGWQLIFDELLAAPLGSGIGTTGAAAEKSYLGGTALDELVVDPASSQLYLPDNQFVKVVIELGPLGLWLLLLLGAAVVAAAVRAARRTTGDDQALAQGIAASVIGAAFASLVSTYLEIFPLDFYFWLLVGVLVSVGSAPDPGGEGAESYGAGTGRAGTDGVLTGTGVRPRDRDDREPGC